MKSATRFASCFSWFFCVIFLTFNFELTMMIHAKILIFNASFLARLKSIICLTFIFLWKGYQNRSAFGCFKFSNTLNTYLHLFQFTFLQTQIYNFWHTLTNPSYLPVCPLADLQDSLLSQTVICGNDQKGNCLDTVNILGQ